MPGKIGIYCRVSTRKQKEEGKSLQDQEKRGRAWAAKQGEPCEVYSEAESAKSVETRRAWRKLEADIHAKIISKVWVIDNDRLSRDRLDAADMERLFRREKVGLYIDGQYVDWDDPSALLLYGIKGVTSDFFRKDLIRKVKRGIKASVDAGEWRTWRLIGYRVPTEKGLIRREIIEEQAALVRKIYRAYNDGMSIRKLADRINGEGHRTVMGKLFTRTEIRRILINPRFSGRTPNDLGELIPSKAYPAIIDPKLWDSTQKLIRKGSRNNVSAKASHLCTSILRCGSCGAAYHYHGIKSHNTHVPCYAHSRTGTPCDQRPVLVKSQAIDACFTILYALVMMDTDAVNKFHTQEVALLEQEKADAEDGAKRIAKLIGDLLIQKQNLVDAIAQGTIEAEDAAEKMMQIKSNIEKLESDRQQRAREIRLKTEATSDLLAEYSAENIGQFAQATGRLRRDMLRRIVLNAAITGRRIHVEMTSGHAFDWEYTPKGTETLYASLDKKFNIKSSKAVIWAVARRLQEQLREKHEKKSAALQQG